MNGIHLRRAALLVLAATGALAMFEQDEPAIAKRDDASRGIARTAAPTQRGREPAPPPAFDASRLDRLAQRIRSEQEAKDPFAVDEPVPAGKPEPAAPPPPPPQAPELPFRFLGSQEAAGKQTIFLEQQQETLIVSVGETIQGAWRLDAVNPRAALFTYLPLGQQKALPLGGPG